MVTEPQEPCFGNAGAQKAVPLALHLAQGRPGNCRATKNNTTGTRSFFREVGAGVPGQISVSCNGIIPSPAAPLSLVMTSVASETRRWVKALKEMEPAQPCGAGEL